VNDDSADAPSTLARGPGVTRRPAAGEPSVLRMAAPLVVSFVMRAAFTLVDTAYAATVGDAAVAAVGLTIPFEFLMIAVWVGLSTGLTSCMSRAMGAHEGDKIRQYLRVTWILVIWASPAFVLVAVGIWIAAPHMKLDPAVSESFRIYGTVLVGGSALTTFWSVIPDSIVKAHHDTRSTMWAGIWSNVINVVLNTIFTFGFHWGVFGIALSTVIGRFGGLAYALRRARLHEQRRLAEGVDGAHGMDPHPCRSLLGLATPSALTFALTASETALVNWFLARGADATAAIAAFSVYYRVALFALNPVIATGVAMLPYAARMHGAGNVGALARGLRQALTASAVYSVAVIAPLVLVFAGPVANAVSESAQTAHYAAVLLRLVPLACLTSAPFLLCRPFFEGLGRGRPGLGIAALRHAVLLPALLWLGMYLSARLRVPPLYGALAGSLIATSLASAVFVVWTRGVLRTASRAATAENQ